MIEDSKCPSCGQTVQANWKICPYCEKRLAPRNCPRCGLAVEPGWRRCPECEARLICPDCGNPIPPGHDECPDCNERISALPGADPRYVEPVTGMTFVLVPGGSFDMGDLFDEGAEDEKPVHAVRIDAFYLAITPVTQAQWAHLMDSLPFKFKGHDRPVEQVSWPDVRDFIARINQKAPEGRHFDLPTEAQWEYAARSAGGVQRYAGSDEIDPVGWYAGNSGGSTRPVSLKHPNGLGLYDMSGNVWEWCRDRFREDAYHLHGAVNPVITEDGADRVIRGGAWHLDAWSARCSRRFSYPETASGPALGFRLVMEAVQ